MIENDPKDVSTAFDILLEEIEAEIEFINNIGSRAFEQGDYDKAREAADRGTSLTAFRSKVLSLREEWEAMVSASEQTENNEIRAERQKLGRLRRGLRTPEKAYYHPILQALVEAGGKLSMKDTLERVKQLMQAVLKEVDFEPLSSDPETPRWRNTAQWARDRLVRKGLLKSDSPRGIWEITDAGRAWLERAGKARTH